MKKIYTLILVFIACDIWAQPTRNWGTYYGETTLDMITSVVTDASGNVYVVGYTSSSNSISTIGSHQPTFGGSSDAFLVKFNSSGVRQWATYYGGAGAEYGRSCAVDAAGNVYISGNTSGSTGTTVATTGSHQQTPGGGNDGFLAKFSSSGVRQWATYYGGAGTDGGEFCAVDGNGDVYLCGTAGSTTGTVIATPGSHQSTWGGSTDDAYLVKFNSSGVRQWGTYYGGSTQDFGESCSVDATGNVYLSGQTSGNTGTAIATAGSHQSAWGGSTDGFLVKFNSSGVRQWGTYYGGSGADQGEGCATDANGNVYLVGSAASGSGLSTIGSHQNAYGGAWDVYLVKFNGNGVRQWGTYYGSSLNEQPYSCSTDAAGDVYITGVTNTNTGTVIATAGSHQSILGGGSDAFLAKFNTNGIRQWGTYYGGAGSDVGATCAFDAFGNGYLAGYTASNTGTAIASASGHQTTYGGGSYDGFLAQFTACSGVPSQPSTISGLNSMCVGAGATNYSIASITGATSYTWILPAGWGGSSSTETISATPGSTGIFTVTASNACGTSPQQTLNVTVNPLPSISVNSGSICSGNSFTIIPSGASTYTIQGGSAIVSPGSSTTYTVVGTSTAGCVSASSATSTVTVNTTPTISMSNGTICPGGSFTLSASGANTYTYSSGPVVSPAVTTTYSAIGSSTAGCNSASTTAVVTITNNLVVSITGTNAVCSGQSLTLTVNGASTYTWNTTTTTTTIAPTPTTNTTYSVIGASGSCTNSALINVTVNPTPTITASSNNPVLCLGSVQVAVLTASGATSYVWNPGGPGTSINVSPSVTTTYTITGTGSNGCSNTAVVTQTVVDCTGLAPLTSNENGFTVYPNPFNNAVTISSNTKTEISIFNILGSRIYVSTIESGKIEIDLSQEAKGIYFINTGTEIKKIIKE